MPSLSSLFHYNTSQRMRLYPVFIALLLLLFLNAFTASNNNPVDLTTQVSVNCGSSGDSAALNGKEWIGDVQAKSSSLIQIKGSSTTSTVIHSLISADPVPHKTARISLSQFSYAFQVSPGQKILRLHFNSASYKGFKRLKDLFTVEGGPFTLLNNFSASLTASALGVNSFAKEFCISIEENQTMSITFSPVNSQSGGSTYAFIDGIEIIPVPVHLSYFKGGDLGALAVGQMSLLYIDNATALELIHREKVTWDSFSSSDHFDDMLWVWGTVPKPNENEISNLIWKISVDVGFRYLVRIHFCDLGLKKVETDGVIFKVLINEITVYTNKEIQEERDNRGISWYRDYMVAIKGRKQEGKRSLLISLQSYDEFIDGYKLIEGFEIFKLSNPDNSLSSPNALPPVRDSPSWIIQILLSVLGHRNSIATVAVAIIAVINIIVHKLREIWEGSSSKEENKPSARAERLCRCFSIQEIKLATRNFSDGLLIGKGGFGKVYKGHIDNGRETVAIKRLKSNSMQGRHEFLTEIETLTELRHINLVPLIGYCSERMEMILVYDYMPSGTLADHLYKLGRDGNNTSLTWRQRLNICIGAGRGLDYLHNGQRVIHRDVKASNILLDGNFVAKVSDFGLAKPEDRSRLQSHVSTKVKGTRGYLDAYYVKTCKLTRKSDVYAFGVVLLEVLCGRPALDFGVSEDEWLLSRWALNKISKGEVDQIVASDMREEISPNSLKIFIGVAERCLDDEPKNRPTMSQVVLQLESALEQQDNKQPLVLNEMSSASDENEQSVSTGHPTMTSTEMQNLTPSKEKSNSTLVNSELQVGKNVGRKGAMHKQSRLWPWEAFWNRVNPSKENELLLLEIREANINLGKFDWGTIAAATSHFSSNNKVGEGGFGAVYKATLSTGQVVAVKRRKLSCYESLEEFKNEILLLPNLQHRNVIKLLGYCIHREEKLLVYEFMENKSVQDILDDKRQRQHLHWAARFKIIMGIARGLVYLHQDSGLKVIHRDPKSGNILLDHDMNPKISDFAFARTLATDVSELKVARICGTYGYMSPECFQDRKYSIKSDVSTFGIVVLEIVSGRGVMHYSNYQDTMLTFADYAWELWKKGKALDLVDESLGGEFSQDEALRCIQVGLSCINWQPNQRPEMPSVLKMLEGNEAPVEPQDSRPLGST